MNMIWALKVGNTFVRGIFSSFHLSNIKLIIFILKIWLYVFSSFEDYIFMHSVKIGINYAFKLHFSLDV